MRELTPTEKGAIAEAKIYAAAVEAGVVVARPLTEGRRYDLIFDVGPVLLRVQCKWANRTRTSQASPSLICGCRQLGTDSAPALQWPTGTTLGL